MATVNKVDSNATDSRYAEEASPRVLPATPVWLPLEPNSFNDFGGNVTTVARNPINSSRQRKKGVATDLDVSGGLITDLTQTNLQDLLQGFFFASLRRKGEVKNAPGSTTITVSVATVNSRLTRVLPATLDLRTQLKVGNIVQVTGSAFAANNGRFKVSAVTETTFDVVAADGAGTAVVLTDEPASSAISVVVVGHEAAVADIGAVASVGGSFPALTSTLLDFTTLGLIPGEFVFVGGDAAVTRFGAATCNGFMRVRRITANRLEFDKTQFVMATNDGALKAIHIYTGRVLKNELAASIVRRTYQLERTLGKSDTAHAHSQVEYLTGAVPNELTINVPSADKVTVDMGFVAMDHELYAGTTGPKVGMRVALLEAPAFNTSSNLSRVKLAVHTDSNAAPTPLFGFATEFSISINNNVSPDKAVGVFGAFDATAGTFDVSGSVDAYFADVAAIQAVRDNADVTLDMHLVMDNAGISIDLPLLTLGDGRANVEKDQPITLPLTNEAATGAAIDPNMDHTMLMVFFDYLPTLAG